MRDENFAISRRAAMAAAASVIARDAFGFHCTTPNAPAIARTKRQSVSFAVGGQTVFGMFHTPGGDDTVPAALILHGLVASKDQPHRIFVTLAEALAAKGVASLRIDLRGRGDSEGDSIDITPQRDLADAREALEFLATRPHVDGQRLSVVGLSWGGLLGCYLATDPRVRQLALWSSAPGPGPMSWNPKLSEIGDGRRAADEWGNLIGEQFYDELATFKPYDELLKTQARVLIAYGTADASVARAAPPLEQALKERGIAAESFAVQDADHAFMRNAWERPLIAKTVEWLTS